MFQMKACMGVKINKNAQNRLKSCNISLKLLKDYFQTQYQIYLRGLIGSKTKKSLKNGKNRSKTLT